MAMRAIIVEDEMLAARNLQAILNELGNVQVIGAYLQGIFNSILAIVVPATIVVALKEIWELSKEGP